MKISNQTASKKVGFTMAEVLVVLTILLIIAVFVAKVVYREEFREVDKWFAETFGFSHLWVTVPAVTFYLIYLVRARKKYHPRGGRFTLPQD